MRLDLEHVISLPLEDIEYMPRKIDSKEYLENFYRSKLIELVNAVLNNKALPSTTKEQNSLFKQCLNLGVKYVGFEDNNTFRTFIQRYVRINPKANLNWIDTSKITSMYGLLCEIKFKGDVSLWDASNVVDYDNLLYFNQEWYLRPDAEQLEWLKQNGKELLWGVFCRWADAPPKKKKVSAFKRALNHLLKKCGLKS
ncbi:MAG: hypothetical protein II708_02285 [Paludibacteraceae bacterium]|nr:hypothetical protein [Paludibacteraceae bacterium]